MDTSDSGGSDSEESPEPVYKFGWLEQRDLEEDPERVREYFVNDPRFSRTIPLDDTGQTITYAEFGDTTPTSDIVLYMQGIIGSRWHIAPRDRLCRDRAIRLIVVDRPRLDRSGQQTWSQHLALTARHIWAVCTYLEIVPRHIIAHSIGALYTAYLLREYTFLRTNAQVILLAPYFPPTSSEPSNPLRLISQNSLRLAFETPENMDIHLSILPVNTDGNDPDAISLLDRTEEHDWMVEAARVAREFIEGEGTASIEDELEWINRISAEYMRDLWEGLSDRRVNEQAKTSLAIISAGRDSVVAVSSHKWMLRQLRSMGGLDSNQETDVDVDHSNILWSEGGFVEAVNIVDSRENELDRQLQARLEEAQHRV